LNQRLNSTGRAPLREALRQRLLPHGSHGQVELDLPIDRTPNWQRVEFLFKSDNFGV